MRVSPLSFIFAGLLALGWSAPALAVNIIDLHVCTSSGVQNNPYAVGTTVTVTGVVSAGDGSFSSVNTQVQVQDTTAGVTVFRTGGPGLGYHYNLGDSVTVTGQIAQFNGLTEISNASIVTTYSTGNLGEITPLVLTCKQVRDSTFNNTNFTEPNESRLIRINNVTVTGGTWPSVCAGANTNLTIQDASGASITLFIDKDGTACGSSNPSGPFDVVGILNQFKSAAPFTSGYEIDVRGAGDIIPLTPGPNFVGVPAAANVDSVSADIQWATDVVSSSIVEFGATTSYGTTLGDSTLVTAHSVHFAGLSPNHLYHFRVTSVNNLGGRQSGDFSFSTPSNQPGQMNFYFNKSIDASLANPDTANGSADLQAKMLAFINRAQHSIDMAMYSFNAPPVTAALNAKAAAGVKVRFIMEATNTQVEANHLVGIPWITSTFGGNHTSGGIMHNKFIVVDGRDGDPSNDWLWTGSVNATTTQFFTDSNNGLEIQDFGLAQCYETEFEEMWGSSTDTPNSATSKMGNRKSDITPHSFHVNGIPIEVYFGPSDGNEAKYVNYIGQADYGIDFTILTYTSDPIEEAMRSRWNGVPGFYLRGVFDAGSLGDQGTAWPEMSGTGGANPFSPPADVWVDNEAGMNHDKVMIIDEGRTASDPTLLTGSFNWSNAANTVNDENSIIFHNQRIANLYEQYFIMRYRIAGGTGDRTVDVPASVSGFGFAAPFPNPAAGGQRVTFALRAPSVMAQGARASLSLYSVAGRLVRTLIDGPATPGEVNVAWDGKDTDGRTVAPGVYLAHLSVAGQHADRKVVVIP